jgi:hypothetical protein
LQHLKFPGTESNCFKMFRMVLFPVHNRIRFQLHTTKTELQQRTMGPMLLELKLLKYIVSTLNINKTWSTIPVLCSTCPLLMVDDLSELADNTRSTQRQNVRAGMAPKMSAQTPMPTKSCVSWNSSLFRDALLESNI